VRIATGPHEAPETATHGGHEVAGAEAWRELHDRPANDQQLDAIETALLAQPPAALLDRVRRGADQVAGEIASLTA
jgi:hypothetical protein